MKIENAILFLVLMLISIGCKKASIKGILIGDTLFSHQSLQENKELENLILGTLKGNKASLIKLEKFPCGNGAGCYDLGYIITQVIFRTGEDDFIKMLAQISDVDKQGIEGLIAAGLEYGDNNYNGKADNKKLEQEFPKIFQFLHK